MPKHKRVLLTLKIPMYVETCVKMSLDDFYNMSKEWESYNFGAAAEIASKYVDINNIDVGSDNTKIEYGMEIIEKIEDLSEDKEIEINTIAIEGKKPN